MPLPATEGGDRVDREGKARGEPEAGPRPPYLRATLRHGGAFGEVRRILERHGLHTVCEEADCPNRH